MSEEIEDARETHMEHLYAWICRSGDQEAIVAALEDYALRDLGGWLARLNVGTGVPGLIHGLVLVEAAERFMKQKNAGGGE